MYQNFTIVVYEYPEFGNSDFYCYVNRLCLYYRGNLTGSLTIDFFNVSDTYAYFVPSVSANLTVFLSLTTEYSCQTNSSINFIISAPLTFELISYGNYQSLSEVIHRIQNGESVNLNLLNLETVEILNVSDYYVVKMENSTNYYNLIFPSLTYTLLQAPNISVSIVYGVPWAFALPYYQCGAYSILSNDITVQDLNGIVYWEFPNSSLSLYGYLSDPRFSPILFEIDIQVLLPAEIEPIDQTQLLFYACTNQTINILYSIAPNASVSYDTTLFQVSLHPGVISLYSYISQSLYDYSTQISIENDGFTDILDLHLFVYPKLLITLYDIPIYCIIGQSVVVDLRNCKEYIDISYYVTDYQSFSIQTDLGVIEAWVLYIIPTALSTNFSLNACTDGTCVSRSYQLNCYFPLIVSASVPELYVGVQAVINVTVEMNGAALGTNELSSLWVEGTIPNMLVTNAGTILWNATADYTTPCQIKIHASYNSAVSSKR